MAKPLVKRPAMARDQGQCRLCMTTFCWFKSIWSLTHAKVTIGDWKEEYNHDRPHSSLGYRTPRAHAAICTR